VFVPGVGGGSRLVANFGERARFRSGLHWRATVRAGKETLVVAAHKRVDLVIAVVRQAQSGLTGSLVGNELRELA